LSRKIRPKVLVTYSWCRTSYIVLESLAKAGYQVYACDASPWTMGRFSRHTSGYDRVSHPFRNPEQFIADIEAVIKKRKIDILLPIHEDSLIIAQYRRRLPQDLLVICPPYENLARALDKDEIINIATKAGVGVPRKIAPASLQAVSQAAARLGFPLIIKTRKGNSGKGVFKADSAEEAERIFRDTVRRFRLTVANLPILEEYIEGDLYGSCFLAKEGKLKACFVEKYLRWKESKFGTSVLREPCRRDLLEEYTKKMAEALGWTGIGHFDFIATPDRSQAFLVEMNPRFWGALNLAVQNGYNFPLGLVSMYENGEPISEAFSPKKKQRGSLWVVGEIIAAMAEIRDGKWLAPVESLQRIFFPNKDIYYDDFRWSDPLPLLMEMIYYGYNFFRSGYSINPVDVEMMQ